MTRTVKSIATAFAGAMMLALGSTCVSADYLGYDNGDPGNWDLWTTQAGGPCANTSDPKCCMQYNPISACPLADAYFQANTYPRERHARHGHAPSATE